MVEDREKCLRAGCTEYLTKPVEPRVLAKLLARFLPPAEASARPAIEHEVDPELADLVVEYVASLAEQLEELRQALQAGDLEVVELLSHRMRGVGSMYGFPSLTEAAGLIEQATREHQDADLLAELVDDLGELIVLITRERAPSIGPTRS